MVNCYQCNKEIKKKSELLVKPSVYWIYPSFPYTLYHLSCYEDGNYGKHGPITFFKNNKFGLTYFIYAFVVLVVFVWIYFQFFEPLLLVPPGAFLLFNLWIILKIRGVVKNLK